MEDRSSSSSRQQEMMCDTCPATGTVRHTMRNTRERDAVSYLKQKGIYDIVDSLLGELLLSRPYDPYEYLIRLLDRRILARDGLVDSPPPFCSRDIIRQARQVDLLTLLELITNERQPGKF